MTAIKPGTATEPQLTYLPLEQIAPSAVSPRKKYSEYSIKKLAANIQQNGLVQPIIVEQVARGRYRVLAGERRRRASLLAGLTNIKAEIVTIHSDTMQRANIDRHRIAYCENSDREDLEKLDTAEFIWENLQLRVPLEVGELKTLMDRINYAKRHRKMTGLLSGERNGKTEVELIKTILKAFEEYNWADFETYMRLYLPIVLMPDDILQAVREELIGLSHCAVVARLTDSRARQKLLAELKSKKLKTSGLASAVARMLGEPPPVRRGGITKRLTQVEALSRTANFRGEAHRRFETVRAEVSRKREELEQALIELETILEGETSSKA